MKKNILIISLILFVCSLIGIMYKIKVYDNNKESVEKFFVVIDEDGNEDYKYLLKLDDNDVNDPEAEYKEISCNYKIDVNNYIETEKVIYNNDSFLDDIVGIIKDKLNVDIDNSWRYFIHYPNEDMSFGYIIFTYYIDDIISTNRAITFSIENGYINNISYSYLDSYINEKEILYRYNYFINHYKQEKVYDYNDYEEEIKFSYNFGNSKLTYSYYIFYKMNSFEIDRCTAVFIEPKLIENLVETKKIVVMDDSNKQVRVISDNEELVKITELLSRTIPSGDGVSSGNKFSLMLYDNENNLIDTLYVDDGGYIGFGNERNEYLKEKYYNVLVDYLE